MPRTLFGAATPPASAGRPRSPESRYTWLPGLRTLPVDDSLVVVNPGNGGWAAFDETERPLTSLDAPAPQGHTGEFLYDAGLCARDGRPKPFVTQSDYTSALYFFEFAVTTGCNLACTYCFADAEPAAHARKATEDVARLFIDRIAEYRAQTRLALPFIIEFTGGEPLLNFPLIRSTVDYAERAYGDLLNACFVIQSNLTLLNDEILDYVQQHTIGLGGSCDGFAAVHDGQRAFAGGRGSHHIVESNILRLRRLTPDGANTVIAVITQDSVARMPELFLYLYLCGCRELVLRPLTETGRGQRGRARPPDPRSYVEGLFAVLESVITPLCLERGELVKERYLGLTFQHLVHPYRPFMCERSPCGAGRTICAVSPSGDVYACHQSSGNAQFRLGSLHESRFADLLRGDVAETLRRRSVRAIAECRDCAYRHWCGSPCAIAALKRYGSLMEKDPQCDVLRYRYARALRGLLRGELDLAVVGRLAGVDAPIAWLVSDSAGAGREAAGGAGHPAS